MKKLIYLILPFLSAACGQEGSTSKNDPTEPFRVMTFNIRLDTPGDSLNNWQYRKDRAAKAVLFYDADLLGTQEVLHNQLVDLAERLPQYQWVGVGRTDGKEQGEYSALFYKKDRFEALDSGTFWLSETPEVAGSKGWDAAYERVATWARLKDRHTGRQYLAVNTHLDHIGVVARREGINLILKRMEQLGKDLPVILTGDFNSNPQSEVVKLVTDPARPRHLVDSRSASPLIYGPAWSWHGFGQVPMAERELLDYVFVSPDIRVLKYGVLAETENNEYLSDHAPVLVTLE